MVGVSSLSSQARPAGSRQRRSSGDTLAAVTSAIVLAGGKGERLRALTRDVCKPALSFGAAFRIIDFASGCRVPDDTVIDAAWRGGATATGDEPVVLTNADFESVPVHACA